MTLCMRRLSVGLGSGLAGLMLKSAPSFAQPVPAGGIVVQPQPWQWWVQPSHSPVEHDIVWLNLYLMAWLSIILFACIGFVWLFKKVKAGKPPAGAH